MRHKPFYTRDEERWNTWSHAGGIVLALVFGIIFVVWATRGEGGWATVGVVLYLLGMLASYIASTAYHALPARSAWKERLRRVDHAAIYWHIAGAYSPITLIAMRDSLWGWLLFAFVWLAAMGGTANSFFNLKTHSHAETVCFVLMGMSILVAFKPLVDCISTVAVAWIIAEGVAYVAGAVFYSLRRRRYAHTVFHFFVLAGSACHIIAVWDILMQYM